MTKQHSHPFTYETTHHALYRARWSGDPSIGWRLRLERKRCFWFGWSVVFNDEFCYDGPTKPANEHDPAKPPYPIIRELVRRFERELIGD